MSNAFNAQGTVLKRGNGASPEVFTAIGEVRDFNGPGGSAKEIDTTHLTSSAKEWLMGLQDEGELSINCKAVFSDAQQQGLRTDRANRTLRNFKLVFADVSATTASFAAYVKTFTVSGAVDDRVNLAVTLRISGAIVWS